MATEARTRASVEQSNAAIRARQAAQAAQAARRDVTAELPSNATSEQSPGGGRPTDIAESVDADLGKSFSAARRRQTASSAPVRTQAAAQPASTVATSTRPTEPVATQSDRPAAMPVVSVDAVAAGLAEPSAPASRQSGYAEATPTEPMVMTKRSDPYDAVSALQVNSDLLMEQAGARLAELGRAPMSDGSPSVAEKLEMERVEAVRPFATEEMEGPSTPSSARITRVPDRPDSVFNRRVGWNGGKREPNVRNLSQRRNETIAKKVKNWMKNAFSSKGVGFRVYAKMIPMNTLDFREVGVGVQEIVAAMEQDPSMLERLLSPHMDGNEAPIDMWSVSDLVSFINGHEVYVATFKPPNNRGQDIQRRRLRVLTNEQRGIYIHPAMAATYTADFDGDDMEISLDPDVAEMARDPMSYMVGVDGKISLDMKFLPVSSIKGEYVDGKSARDYVREVMLADFSDIDGRSMSSFVDAVIALSETEGKGEDEQEKAYAEVFRKASELAYWATASQTGDPRLIKVYEGMMSRLCKAVYDGMRNLRVNNTLMTMGVERMAGMPEPRTYGDGSILRVIDGMVAGAIPNNFQELKVMLTGYIGSVEGRNAPFRFSADIGKMIKMDSRLQIGNAQYGTLDNNGDFVVDPNSEKQMTMLFESTVKFAESRAMAKEIKKAGRVEYYSQLMREKVIREVGFPDAYDNYADFLMAFVKSYHKNSAIINEANLVFLANMEISSNSNRGIVSPLNDFDVRNPGKITVSELAEPLLTVYGSYSVEHMFRELTKSDGDRLPTMSRNYVEDKYWLGNPYAVRTEIGRGGSIRDPRKSFESEYRTNDHGMMNGIWVTGKYMSHSLRSFAHENRLVQKRRPDVSLDMLVKTSNSAMTAFETLMAIADKRTGTASSFCISVYGGAGSSLEAKAKKKKRDGKSTNEMIGELMADFMRLDTDGSVSGRADQTLWMDDIIDVLAESGPEMFYYFGMDNMAGFVRSKYGLALAQNAGNVGVLGGIRTAMVFEWRMRYILDAIRNMTDPDVDVNRYMDDANKLAFARDELADSSEVWHGIIRELIEEANGKSAFKMMLENNAERATPITGETYNWNANVTRNAESFWRNPGGHTTLRSVIEDLTLDQETKWNVISDIVGYWENDAYLKSYEVPFQLEVGNDSAYALGSAEKQGALKAHNDFKSAFNRWGKTSQSRMAKDVESAAKLHEKKQGRLLNTLKFLDDNPWSLIAIDDRMYANALMSVKDKTYDQTEKASQHPWTNALYAAASFQHNGGYMNDITRTDDRLLGVMSASSVGIHDVVHILSDPDAMLCVYGEGGEIGYVTRDKLLSSALGRTINKAQVTEADIWEFLKQEPRIASAIRQHSACVMADSDGTGYVGATSSIKETISRFHDATADPIGHVKYMMRDHPVYAGIISLTSKSPQQVVRNEDGSIARNEDGSEITRTVGAVSRNERNRVMQIEDYLSHRIYMAASSGLTSGAAARSILEDLGITFESVAFALRSDYDAFLEKMDLPPVDGSEEEAIFDARFTYEVAMKNLAAYVDQVRENVPLGMTPVDAPSRPDFVGVDIVSIASFWDVIQELGGAKTAVSTGIEGAETYRYGNWASQIDAKDRYASLKAIVGDGWSLPDGRWDGMWTNLSEPDGTPIMLQVDESGTITNLDAVKEAASRVSRQGIDEIVCSVPSGFVVPDRSTDTYGNPVPSLSIYMVSKRSNGAEKFNLKAKKAGYDGNDSIIKMQGKHKDGANFMARCEELRAIAQENGLVDGADETMRANGLMAAKMDLAREMMVENEELGYKDMTLANYMCLADLMLVECDDGKLYLRSLEMLFSAIKYRVGTDIDDMTPKQQRDAINAVVRDRGETCVGRMEMASPIEAFDGVRPSSQSSAVDGIKPKSSGFDRNYELLQKIVEDEAKRAADAAENSKAYHEVTPISPAEAARLNKKVAGQKEDGQFISGVVGVRDVIDRASITRNYNVVGYAGATAKNDKGRTSAVRWSIGPSNMFVIGDGEIGEDAISKILDRAYSLGMSVVVSSNHVSKIPSEYMADAIPCSDSGDALLPMFDMRLNGSEAQPYVGGRFAIYQCDPSRLVVSVEDSINQYDLGDAQYRPLRALLNRLRLIDTGSQSISSKTLFPNVYGNSAYNHHSFDVSLASRGEIDALIRDNGVRCTIDYGIVQGARGFRQRVSDVDAAIDRYRRADVNPDGIVAGECAPGDIVGWARMEIQDDWTGESEYVLAPIIPFPLHGPKRQPASFTVENLGPVDSGGSMMHVDWRNTSSLANSFVKYFDSSGGANKGMVNFADVIEDALTLADGTAIDLFCAKASTDSRKIGTDRRIKTMISLMTLARMHGYNFAVDPSDHSKPNMTSFPDNPEIRDRMMHERIPRVEWDTWLKNGDIRFTVDDRLNAFLNYECKKILADGGNPYDYLANTYLDQDGNEHRTEVMWEFEAMFEHSLSYEDSLLQFLNYMDPSFCPSGIEDTSESYLFRLYRDEDGSSEGYDRGVLQMLVPHRNSSGGITYLWDNVYIGMSFFGEDYSGFSRPNVDGSSNFLDGTNTMAYYGAELDKQDTLLRSKWATSDMGRVPRDGGAFGILDPSEKRE